MSVLRKGTTLTLTTGEYSDYRDHGPFIVTKDIDQAAVAEEYRSSYKPSHEWDTPSTWGFIGWLSGEGYIEDITGARSWHLGDYNFEPEIFAEEDRQP